jgi:4-diphosphocytidyl-2-C-methyl-D-erythritol kinase
VRARAPAKINWTLEVLRRRDDGYHEVRTVMQTIDLCDEIVLESSEALSLEVEGTHEPSADDHIVAAVRLMETATGRAIPVKARVHKRIPVGAGLGGGSSDGAAVLRALNQLLELGLSRERLAEIGSAIGSDVPFFAHGGTALGLGRGERVDPLPDVPERWLALLAPPIFIPQKTRRMYRTLSAEDFGDGSGTRALVERLLRHEAPADTDMFNAFERPAFEALEALRRYRDLLLKAGAARVHLAGSGPALFAAFASEGEARSVAQRLTDAPGAVFVARTLGAAEATALHP